MDITLLKLLEEKREWVWRETLKIHKIAPKTRISSSLSCIEIFVALYYGKILNYDPNNQYWQNRDRFIISKGHGSVSMYPILADLGFFDNSELARVCQPGSFLGGIPDPIIPGYETVNGSLGHGMGVGCGIAMALKMKSINQKVWILVGDGEMYEGANWEAIMLAGHHKLDNLILVIDCNKISMLDYTKNIIDHMSFPKKFCDFGWAASEIDGHDIKAVWKEMNSIKKSVECKPKVIVANTIKGKGVPSLENSRLAHVMTLSPEEVNKLLGE